MNKEYLEWDRTKDIVNFEPMKKILISTMESRLVENERELREWSLGKDGEEKPHYVEHSIDKNGNYRSEIRVWESDLSMLGNAWGMRVRGDELNLGIRNN